MSPPASAPPSPSPPPQPAKPAVSRAIEATAAVLAIRLLYFTKGLSFSSGAEGLSSAPVGYVSSTRVSCGAPTSASWGTPGLRVEAIKGVEACQTPGYGAVLCSFCSRERKIPVLLPLPSAAGHVLRPGNSSARNGRMAPVHGKYMVPRFSGGSVADFGQCRRVFGLRHRIIGW